MIKNLILDYNGVISDDFNLVYLSAMRVFQKFNRKIISKNEFKREFAIPIQNFYSKYLPHVPLKKHSQYYFKVYKQLRQPKIFPYVKKTINELHRRKVNLIVVSSHNKSSIISELKKFGIDFSLFKAVYGNIIDKDSFLINLITAAKLNPEEIAYVGDTEYDISIAKRANIISIVSTYGYREKHQLLKYNPDFFINNFSELLKIL